MSGDDVVELSAVRLAPVPEVVESLEDLLKRAKSGEVRGFVFICAADQRTVATSFEPGEATIADLYYATGLVQRRLLDWEGPQ